MFKSSKIIIVCALLSLTSCVSVTHYPEVKFELPPKQEKDIQFLTQQPRREAIRIASTSLEGSAYSTASQLQFRAKLRAAKVGGDFIMAESLGKQKPFFLSSCVQSYDTPCGYYSIWAYTPSKTGLKLDNSTIIGFNLESDAPEADVCIGDALIGINGYDLNDDLMIQHMMSIQPGDQIHLNLIRKGKRIERVVTALSN